VAPTSATASIAAARAEPPPRPPPLATTDYKGALDCYKQVFQKHGIRRFYQVQLSHGLGATLVSQLHSLTPFHRE